MQSFRLFLSLILVSTFLISCASGGATGRQFGPYSEAERYYQNGKFGDAASQYEKYLSENPQGALVTVASYYLAKCYVALGRKDEAKAGFQKIITESPKTTWADFSKKQLEVLGA